MPGARKKEIIRRKDVDNIDRGGYRIKRLFTKIFQEPPSDIGFYETTIPKGGVCKEQWHEKSYEIVYFLTPGSAKLKDQVYTFDKGDLVILDPGEKHEWQATNQELIVFAMRLPHLIEDKYTTE